MSLRAVCSLLARRFSPLGNRPSAHAAGTGRPARSFRGLAVGGGATAAFSGLVAALYFNKGDTEDYSVAEATGEETGKEIVEEPYMSREKAIKAGFVGKDGKVNWPEYFDDEEVDEAAMKARFEDWMKEYGRTYWTRWEKARRYEIFKDTAMRADKANASKPRGARLDAPNGLADRTDEECKCCCDNHFDWETYVDHINFMAANGWYIIGREELAAREAAKQRSRNYRPGKRKEGVKGPKPS